MPQAQIQGREIASPACLSHHAFLREEGREAKKTHVLREAQRHAFHGQPPRSPLLPKGLHSVFIRKRLELFSHPESPHAGRKLNGGHICHSSDNRAATQQSASQAASPPTDQAANGG
ncbi:unnamed protein product [Boreogadus saida]